MSDSYSSIAQLLLNESDIVLITHTNPDADAYGSMCGLGLALRNLGKNVTMVNEQGAHERFHFMPGVLDVKSAPAPLKPHQILVSCDCAAAQRVGDSLKDWLTAASRIVNIDHHFSNTRYGTAGNLVVEDASSTCEMIYDLICEMDSRSGKVSALNADIANNLLTGIMGDTGLFRYENTTAKTFATAHNLYLVGARSNRIAQELFAKTSLNAVRMQAAALSRMELDCNGRFLRITVSNELLEEFGADIEDTDVLVERGRDINGVDVCALVKQDNDIWRVSLRSKTQVIDVSSVASKFGGGGHRCAAAFRWRKSLEELLKELHHEIKVLLGESRAN